MMAQRLARIASSHLTGPLVPALVRILVRGRLIGRRGPDGGLVLPARFALRLQGRTPGYVEDEVFRRAGPGDALFGGLDAGALGAVGVDLAAVRARIESSFGPDVLAQAARASHRAEAGRLGHRGSPLRLFRPRPGRLVLLRQAYPDLFDAVIADVVSNAGPGGPAPARPGG
jgi:hypothetical protein